MFDLNTFFEGLSKPKLREVHVKAFGKKGLLNNALIQKEALDHYSDKERVSLLFSKLEPYQRRVLNLLYHSGSRGLSYNELRLVVPVSKARELQEFLLSMCREFVLWRSFVGGNPVYLPFSNFIGMFEMEPEETPNLGLPTVSYQNLLDWHICLVLALAQKKELRVNSNGSLHRHSRQICASYFKTISKISEKLAENELTLIFSFLTMNGWLEQEDAYLLPSSKALEFLRKNGFRLHQDILAWWVKVRFHDDRVHACQLLNTLRECRHVSDAVTLFWVTDPSFRILEKNKALSIEFIPRPLRELWILGLVDFRMSQGKIDSVVMNKFGSDWVDSSVVTLPEPSLSTLPNFDLVASIGTSPRVLFTLACLAEIRNDEPFLCFTLEKETYLSGLKSGLPEAEIEHFRSWINPPENVNSTLHEWNTSFYGAKVRTVRLLKIDDLSILSELSRFPEFVQCTEEYIPGYGFVLKESSEKRAFEILENYGFCPFVDGSNVNRLPAPTEEWKTDFLIHWHNVKAPDFEMKELVDEDSMQATMNSTKYGNLYQKLSTFDLVKVLRYAKMAGTLLSAQVKDPNKRGAVQTEKTFYVHSLKLSKSPFTAEIQEYGTDPRYPLDLSFIQEIKVLNKKTLA